jgi:LacI family transcriptional regulator
VLEELASRVDGMLIFSRLPEAQMARLLALGKPLVLFGRPQGLDVSWVASEDHRGAYMLARHLVSLGHRRIAYLGFSRSRRDAERMAGLRACLDSHGLALTLFDCATPTADDGHHACASIMLGRERPDALVCFNDLMAMGFMKAAQVLGFKLPRDISVAGFDNIEFGKYMSPPLTSVDLRSEAMGAAAMRKLIAALDGTSVDETIIEPKLIVRGSTLVRQRTPLAVPAVAA